MAKRKRRLRDWNANRPKFYECGGCGHWHPLGWTGDCRDDSQRFTSDQLDERYPDVNKDGWPDWVEVDEVTGEEV